VLNYVKEYPTDYSSRRSFSGAQDDRGDALDDSVMLKLTHGTGDDNVHHQNTLLLIDALHKEQKKFDFMIYPDGMHGYYSYQGIHFQLANRDFWFRYLLGR
jgi:dipeptidyl-peptidase-4